MAESGLSAKRDDPSSDRRTNDPASKTTKVANIGFETEGVLSAARRSKPQVKGGDARDLRVTDRQARSSHPQRKAPSQKRGETTPSPKGDGLRVTHKADDLRAKGVATDELRAEGVAIDRFHVTPGATGAVASKGAGKGAVKDTSKNKPAANEGAPLPVEDANPPVKDAEPSENIEPYDTLLSPKDTTPQESVPSSKDLRVSKGKTSMATKALKVKGGMNLTQKVRKGSIETQRTSNSKALTSSGAKKGDKREPRAVASTRTIAGVATTITTAASTTVATVAATVTTFVATLGPVLIATIVCVAVVASVMSMLITTIYTSLVSTSTTTNYYLDGLPSWVTYELVLTALEMQEEYGHPAGCTIAQMIYESGSEKSDLASTYHNLFGITYVGMNDWVTGSVVLSGNSRTWAVFNSDVSCIEYRSYMISVSSYYDNDLVTQAIAECDSDLMAQGLEEGGWSGSGYAESLISVMEYYDLYRFDGLTVEEFESSYTGDLLPDEYEDLTDAQKAVVDACYTTPFQGTGWCAKWVQLVYANSGLYDGVSLYNQTGYCSQLNATTYHQSNGITGNACCLYWGWADYNVYTDGLGALEAGMMIASVDYNCISSSKIGHVGIYIGTIDGVGYVMHNSDTVAITPLDEWIDSYSYGSTYVGYGWIADIDLSEE